MKIKAIDIFVYKYNHHYKVSGHSTAPDRILGTDYYFEPNWKHVYSRLTESCLIKITTDDELTGWGEAQSPIVPEVVATLIARLLGPAIIGLDAHDVEYIHDRLYHLNHVRGHTTSFTIDAIAALDMALWDIKGKSAGKALHKLLGEEDKIELPLYVSGLRQPDLEGRKSLAKKVSDKGFKGIKIFSGDAPAKLVNEFASIRSVIPEIKMLAFDAISKYDYNSALQIGRGLDDLNATWFESPLYPEDIDGHTKLAKAIKTPVAIGETLRTAFEFKPWIEKCALDIAQPDIVRCGITGGKKIVDLLQRNGVEIALHVGVCSAIGMAATWHFAAALPDVLIQEHQFEMFEAANKVLNESLTIRNGNAVIPTNAGLGVDVNEQFIREHCSEHWLTTSNGTICEKLT